LSVLKVFFHDRCFDGTASAALFARFHRDVIAPGGSHRLVAVGLRHTDGDPFEGVAIDGDDNACVDFRWSPSPRLRWWFDHHKTAFQPASLRAEYDARASDTQWFDPDAPSCTGMIRRILGERGWTPPPALTELVEWAEVIDAAAFASAEQAISLAEPAQRLAVWLGAVEEGATEKIGRYIEALASGVSLAELDRAPWVRAALDPVIEGRQRGIDALGKIGEVRGDLVVFDLLDRPELPSPGFVGYALYPACRYVVAVSRAHGTIKVAVGHNPWSTVERRHDVGALCQQHGGGGHAAVGGITLEPGETDRARAAVAAIVKALQA
jgi:hypothetical protein